ncbi:hypothetical protein [Spiroplasma floricola]|uniref:Uncharacterized protein n=1 Tax=Spiroplasma floricola 23-6 TaxID=1336749 RepID=A0A2K8SCN8_9MOLU|nr:hypothetical protein [Spiroplasma floricola]AUB31212.1 hypothetical protein SFLOR_v1c01510 [Spiroplasma floricola 23-6]
MFLRINGDINYYLRRSSFIKYFDEHNLSRKSKWYIKRVEKKVNDKNTFTYFKYWILWRWINLHFKLSENFVTKLNRNIKKLSLTLTSREEKFIRDLEELIFNSWRPLKQLPVKFDLERKEKINLIQTNVNIHNYSPEKKEKKLKLLGKFDCYFSNFNIYLTDNNQKVIKIIKNNSISEAYIETFGVVIITDEAKFLFRGKNRLLTCVLLQRMIPRLNLKLESTEDLYNYFDFWNKLVLKFS